MNKIIIPIFLSVSFFLIACSGNSSDHQYTGILEGTSVQVPALTPGQITQIFVSTGEYVEKGTSLAVVDSTDLIYQREQLTASYEELTIQIQSARENVLRASQDYDYLRIKHERIANLYKSESVTKQALDDITNNLQNSQTALSNARNMLGSLAAGQKRIEAQIKSVNKKIRDALIIAPTKGVITDIFYEIGEAIPQYSPLLEIIDISTMEIKIYISEQLLSQIKYGQKVAVTIDGLDQTVSGLVIWVSPKAEFTPKTILTPNTRTSLVYAVKISIENEQGILKHGMPAVISLN
jgi:HlyD family secretion protein